jgi:hypothetical protein
MEEKISSDNSVSENAQKRFLRCVRVSLGKQPWRRGTLIPLGESRWMYYIHPTCHSRSFPDHHTHPPQSILTFIHLHTLTLIVWCWKFLCWTFLMLIVRDLTIPPILYWYCYIPTNHLLFWNFPVLNFRAEDSTTLFNSTELLYICCWSLYAVFYSFI